jgi:HemY protein
MIKKIIMFSSILLLCAWLGNFFIKQPGYMMIQLGNYRVESTFLSALLAWLALWFALKISLSVISNVLSLPQILSHWRKQKFSLPKQLHHLQTGLKALSNGDWKKAEKKMIAWSKVSEHPSLGMTFASMAAYLRGKTKLAEKHRLQAIEQEDFHKPTLLMAYLLEKQNRLDEAYALLLRCYENDSNHEPLINMLCQLSDKRHDHEACAKWLNIYQTQIRALPQELETLHAKTQGKILSQMPVEKRDHHWQDLPYYCRSHPDCLKPYLLFLLHESSNKKAYHILKEAIEQSKNVSLLNLFCQTPFDSKKQLSNMQKWEQHFASQSQYWQALGKLYEQVPLFQQALSCYEKAYGLEPSTTLLIAQASMHEKLNHPDKASQLKHQLFSQLAVNTRQLSEAT